MICPVSRADALTALDDFLPLVPLYARDRNHVKPGHPSVSRLSPAIRHRLITEEEVVAAVLGVHRFGRAEKFVQEVYWRRYWKSWLALRPQIWREFHHALPAIHQAPSLQAIEQSRSGNRVIDHFSNELVTTGYLHNHARMWFAGWWIHQARLPWQAGAAFFYRCLLDGDPASNTLSWRWVAGLHTPGKTYLARRTNLEKYLAPELLDAMSDSLPDFEHSQPFQPSSVNKVPAAFKTGRPATPDGSLRTGLWVHEEDLSPETSPLGSHSFAAVLVVADSATWDRFEFPALKKQWISHALSDASTRAARQWTSDVSLETSRPLSASLPEWAESRHLKQILALRPDVGPLQDQMPSLARALAAKGIRLVFLDRPEDMRLQPLATGGFFGFWEKLRKQLLGHDVSGKDLQLRMDFC